MKKILKRIAIKIHHLQIKGDVKPDFEPFYYAMLGYYKLKSSLWNPDYITIVDLSKSNTEKRFFVINMNAFQIETAIQTGHGKKSWEEFATSFSNEIGSNQTSLWFYTTEENIQKARTKDRSGLLLNGIEPSNDNARKRGIFIHPAGIDQSEWCFTLPMSQEEANIIMDKIKGRSLLFAYYPDQNYLASSQIIC